MVETLTRGGDEDDYFERGVRAAEMHANGYGIMGFDVINVSSGAHNREPAYPSELRKRIVPFAGFITTRREIPPFSN